MFKKNDKKKTIDPMTKMLVKTVAVHAAVVVVTYGGLTLLSKKLDESTDSE